MEAHDVGVLLCHGATADINKPLPAYVDLESLTLLPSIEIPEQVPAPLQERTCVERLFLNEVRQVIAKSVPFSTKHGHGIDIPSAVLQQRHGRAGASSSGQALGALHRPRCCPRSRPAAAGSARGAARPPRRLPHSQGGGC